jgi:hypothetical protein
LGDTFVGEEHSIWPLVSQEENGIDLKRATHVIPKLTPAREVTQREFINLQAKAAIAMRNMDLSCSLIDAAMDKATAMDSQWGCTDAWEVYQQIKPIWSRESKVKL